MKTIPLHRPTIDFFPASDATPLCLPYFSAGISCGFPSPAADFEENSLDFNKDFIKNPSATFYGRANGNSMKGAGIHHGDILVVDRSAEWKDNMIAVCVLDGDFTLKRLRIDTKKAVRKVWLVAENEEYPPIRVTDDNELVIWGILIHVIKSF